MTTPLSAQQLDELDILIKRELALPPTVMVHEERDRLLTMSSLVAMARSALVMREALKEISKIEANRDAMEECEELSLSGEEVRTALRAADELFGEKVK